MRLLAAREFDDLLPSDDELDPYGGRGAPLWRTAMDQDLGFYGSCLWQPVDNGSAPALRRTNEVFPGFNTPKGDFDLIVHAWFQSKHRANAICRG